MEVTVDQAINLLRAEEARVQELTNQLNQAIALMNELQLARITLENLPEEESEVLLPIGSGVFVPSKATRNAKILVNIGSGVVVEKTVEEAVQFLKTRIETLDKTIKQISSSLNQANKNVSVLRRKIDEVLRSRQNPTVVG